MKELRKRKGLTQRELAVEVEFLSQVRYNTKIHLSWKTIDAIEKFRYKPSLELSTLISEVLRENLRETFTYMNNYKVN